MNLKIKTLLVINILIGLCPLCLYAQNNEDKSWQSDMDKPHANFYDIQAKAHRYFEAKNKSDDNNNDNKEEEENAELMTFKRWEWFWKNRVNNLDSKNPGNLDYSSEAIFNYRKQHNDSSKTDKKNSFKTDLIGPPSPLQANWQLIGPFSTTTQNMGIVISLFVDPINSNIIYVGSNTAGLWKTINGGATWSNLTDVFGWPGMGVQSIVVDPANSNIIYIATGLTTYGRGYGVGVLKTINGGASWNTTGLSYTVDQNIVVQKLLIDPTNSNILYAIGDKSVYKTTNGGTTWSIVFTNTINSKATLRDIEFKPNDHNTLYLSSDDRNIAGGGAKIWVCNDAYNALPTWINVTPNVIASNQFATSTERIGIAVTPADPNSIYILYSDTGGSSINDSKTRLEKSTNNGATWTLINSYSDLIGGIGYWTLEFEISPTDVQVIYTGSTVMYKSNNSGVSFNRVSDYFPCSTCRGHADIRALKIYQGSLGGNSDIVFMGNDGGITKTTDGTSSWQNINGSGLSGLVITQFYGLSGSELNPQLIEGGTQDNGIFTMANYTTWYNQVVGDAYDCVIDKADSQFGYANTNGDGVIDNNYLLRTNTGSQGQSWYRINEPSPPNTGLLDRPISMHPINNALYMGYHDVFKCANPRNSSMVWQQLSNFTSLGVPSGSSLVAVNVARSDVNTIYAVFGEPTWSTDPPQKKIFKTTNGGATWTDISVGLLAVQWAGITDIEIDPQNPQKIWLTFGGFWPNGTGGAYYRVVRSINGGITWTDYSEGLPALPHNVIVYERGSNDGLYVGTDAGVYFRNASMTAWQPFDDNLPPIIVSDLEINYASNTIRAATFGRGIWESHLQCPLDNDRTLNNISIGSAFFEAKHNITSNAQVAGTVNFRAGNEIILTSGFQADPGCDFRAFIHNCDINGNSFKKNNELDYVIDNTLPAIISPTVKDIFTNTKIYPNPNNGSMQIDYTLPENEPGLFEIFDLAGKKMLSYPLKGGKNNLTISNADLGNGIYLYQLLSNDRVIAKDKLVIIK